MIIIKNDKEIDLMRIAGRIVAETLLLVEKEVRPGITTAELDRIAEEFITKHGAKPSFKGLYGFPASLCISVNEQVVHGIPGGYVLKEGDIISVDCGANINGFHGDAARTFAVGNISEEAKRLIKVTEESFFKGLEFAKVGNKLTDISHEIQRYVEVSGFSVVREFVGHGIGKSVHEDPEVPNFGRPGRGPKLVAGMALAIEPMVNMGSDEIWTDELDEWTVRTEDGLPSAQWEVTVLVTETGCEVICW